MALNQTTELQKRSRTLHFIASLSATEMTSLKSGLRQLDAITKVDVNESKLTIEYDFPLTCFGDAWQIITEQVDAERIKLSERWKSAIAAFAEQNESDHINFPGHWHTYAKDIYVHYFDRQYQVTKDTRFHLWRRYQHKS